MSFMQINYLGQPVATRTAIFNQNAGQVVNATTQQTVFDFALAPGNALIIPAGEWTTMAGQYSDVQVFDNMQQRWLSLSIYDSAPTPINSDGTNYRFANTTGCPIGAVVTTAGTAGSLPVSMYTSTGVWTGGTFTAQATPAVGWTVSAGTSTWNTFIGGAISQTIAITNGGSGYNTFPPKVLILPPANQGAQPFIPASAVCTISGGAVATVTVTNQGAGYVSAPTIVVLNAPGDLSGTGCVLTATLTGAGQVTAVVNATLGTAQTAVITLTGTGASLPAGAACTVLMNFTVTAAGTGTVTAGSGYTNGYQLMAVGGLAAVTPTYKNPTIELGITTPVQPIIYSASTSVQNLNSANTIIVFGGYGYQAVPLVLAGVGITSGGFITAPTVGGTNDICLLYPL